MLYAFGFLALCIAFVIAGFFWRPLWMQAEEAFLVWMVGFFVKHPERSWYRW
jgi:hypothetical protein